MGNDPPRPSRPVNRNTRARFLLAVVTVGLTVVVMLGGLVGLDLSLHTRFEKAAGLNYRGYRGAVVKPKPLGEQRVVVLGGSTAFGYGVTAEEAFPAILERKLTEQRRQGRDGPISVVNLAYNNEGAYSFVGTLQDYAALDYDVAILYEGYNDLDPTPNLRAFRRDSPVFRWTGYLPDPPAHREGEAHGASLRR